MDRLVRLAEHVHVANRGEHLISGASSECYHRPAACAVGPHTFAGWGPADNKEVHWHRPLDPLLGHRLGTLFSTYAICLGRLQCDAIGELPR